LPGLTRQSILFHENRWMPGSSPGMTVRAKAASRAFSSEVDTGSREENASNQNHRARF
jgi:hypothetical protein